MVAAIHSLDSRVSMPRMTLGMRMRAVELMRKRKADSVDGFCVQRRFAGDGANAVGAKQLSHDPCTSLLDPADAAADATAREARDDGLAFRHDLHELLMSAPLSSYTSA